MPQYAKIVEHLRDSFNEGITKPLKYREHQLKQLKEFLEENENAICAAVHKDLGRCNAETQMFEILFSLNEIKVQLENLSHWAKPEKVSRTLTSLMDSAYIVKDPLGVVLVIGAWNYPIQVSICPVIGAIAAGNCVVLKPSEVASHTSKLLAEMLPRYLDEKTFAVVEGGVEETTNLLKERFDHIIYTGAPPVGKIVMKAAAEHLTPVTLELGGKCPTIFDEGTNLQLASRRLAWAKFVNNGQTCLAPDYLLLVGDSDKLTQVVDELRKSLHEFYGDKLKSSADYSRIINERHFDRIKKLIDNTKGTKAIGGSEMDREQKFIEATVLTHVLPDDVVMNDEIFGPILPIITVPTFNDAIKFINSKEKPLAIYAFIHDKHHIENLLESTSSGGVTINDFMMHAALDTLPFGGVGCSGMGAYHGKFSFDTFSHKKAVIHRGANAMGDSIMSIRYPPFDEKKESWAKTLMPRRSVPFL